MDYITLDLEWNQAYMQQALAVQKRIGSHLHGEVIQIGAVKLNEEMQIVGSYSIIVKPKFFCKLHRHVRDLTGITQHMIDRGTPLPEAAESFRRWCGKEFVLLTWGPDDVPMFRENLTAHKIASEWLDCDYDLQRIYSRQKENGAEKQRSLEFAMEALGVEQTLPAHDALNDAYFTALVAQRLNTPGGVKDYGERGEHHLFDKTYGDADIGEEGYESVEDILRSPEAAAVLCPICGARLEECGKTLHGRGHRYRILCRCQKDGDLFITMKVFPNHNGTFRLRKTVTVADPAECEVYRKKLDDAAQKRRRRPRRRRRSGQASAASGAAATEG